jgi:hypothetical protein
MRETICLRLQIAIELMVYFKYWDSDFILQQVYHLARLVQGKSYGLYFTINIDLQIRNEAAHFQFFIEKIRVGIYRQNTSGCFPRRNYFILVKAIDGEDVLNSCALGLKECTINSPVPFMKIYNRIKQNCARC